MTLDNRNFFIIFHAILMIYTAVVFVNLFIIAAHNSVFAGFQGFLINVSILGFIQKKRIDSTHILCYPAILYTVVTLENRLKPLKI